MLPKSHRLSAREVRDVLRTGKSLRAEGVSIKYTKGQDAKVAVVVSSKIAKRAVDRNRLRRAGYLALKVLPRLHIVVFIQTKDFNPDALTSLCSKLSS